MPKRLALELGVDESLRFGVAVARAGALSGFAAHATHKLAVVVTAADVVLARVFDAVMPEVGRLLRLRLAVLGHGGRGQ